MLLIYMLMERSDSNKEAYNTSINTNLKMTSFVTFALSSWSSHSLPQ
jgi:hypothetical protein